MTEEKQILKRLQSMPNVGPATARDLVLLGITECEQLRGKNPESLYQKLEETTGHKQDPCVLDTLRAVVHFAETGDRKMWWEFTPLRKKS